MPVLVLQPPTLPPLSVYFALSFLSLSWCILQARDMLATVEQAMEAGVQQPLKDPLQAPPVEDLSPDAVPVEQQMPPQYLEDSVNETLFMLGIGPDDSVAFKLFKVMMVDIWSVLVSLE